MKIATFTDHLITPSSRFRIRQYIPLLEEEGIFVHDYCRRFSTQTAAPEGGNKRISESFPLLVKALAHESLNVLNRLHDSIESNRYDVVWLSRQLIIGYPSFEMLIRKPLVYDIDDAIFLSGKLAYLQFKITTKNASAVIAGNDFLADEASKYCKNVFIIPTAVDTSRFVPARRELDKQNFVVGWSGTSSSYKFFQPLEDELAEFFKIRKNARLKICSDRFPYELSKLAQYIDFEPWSSEVEVSQMQSFDVGIMPLEDSDWVKGKCSYKMLLYASCGVPTITSPYGMNKDVLALGRLGIGCENSSQWRDALEYVYMTRESLSDDFPDCRKSILENYSLDVISKRISTAMRSAIA